MGQAGVHKFTQRETSMIILSHRHNIQKAKSFYFTEESIKVLKESRVSSNCKGHVHIRHPGQSLAFYM